MNYLTHKIKIELNRCNKVMYLHLKIDIEESALKTNDVGGNDGRYKDRRIRIRTNSRKENRGINGKVLHKKKKKNSEISLNRPIISIVISKTGERVGVTVPGATSFDIFVSKTISGKLHLSFTPWRRARSNSIRPWILLFP